jgi:hypothetical protein
MFFVDDVVLVDESDPRVSQKLKVKFYRTVIQPVMLYGAECRPTKTQHVQQLSVVEMCMLLWICGHIKRDRVRNDDVGEIRSGTSLGESCATSLEIVWTYPTEAPARFGIISRTGNGKRGRVRSNLI